jgi:hypothetical protein
MHGGGRRPQKAADGCPPPLLVLTPTTRGTTKRHRREWIRDYGLGDMNNADSQP